MRETNNRRSPVTGGQAETTTADHRPGDANVMPRDLFHEVSSIHEPGRTLTLMVGTGPGVKGSWGYLDVDSLTVTQAPRPTAAWPAMLRDLNPHRDYTHHR